LKTKGSVCQEILNDIWLGSQKMSPPFLRINGKDLAFAEFDQVKVVDGKYG